MQLADDVADVRQVGSLILGNEASSDNQGRLVAFSPQLGENIAVRLKAAVPESLTCGGNICLGNCREISLPIGICSPFKDTGQIS